MWDGMENIAATTLTQRTIHDEHNFANSEGLVAHELAHQWWGDLLTCRDWSHLWLNEGFATYFTALWIEHMGGKGFYNEEMLRLYQWYIQEKARPLVWSHYEDPVDLFDGHSYAKGAWVLHMLRAVVGEQNFWHGIRLYLQRHQGRSVTSSDLRFAMEDASGKNLEWFFQQWLDWPGHPKLEVKWSWDEENKMAVFHVKQKQSGQPYRFPVEIELYTPSNPRRYRVICDHADQKMYLPCAEKPLFVCFDKHGQVLKELDFPRDWRECLNQLEYDAELWSRRDAVKALAGYPNPEVVAALCKVLEQDKFHEIRFQVLQILGNVYTEAAYQAVLQATYNRSSAIREAAIHALNQNRMARREVVFKRLRELFDTDPTDSVKAAALRGLSHYVAKVRDSSNLSEDDFQELLGNALHTPSFQEILRCAALEIYGYRAYKKSLPTLKDWVQYGKPSPCRLVALRSFYYLSRKEPEATVSYLLPLLRDKYYEIRRDTIDYLAQMGQPMAVPALIEVAEKDPWNTIRRQARKAVDKILRRE